MFLLNLCIYIEHYTHNEIISKEIVTFGCNSSRNNIVRMFNLLLSNDDFQAVSGQQEGRLGNHSIRKGKCTYTIRSGFPREYLTCQSHGRERSRLSTL